jgi:hypothetical protein
LTDQEPDLSDIWRAYVKDFKKSPVSHSLFWITFLFAIFGFIYNNLQNPNNLFISAWFFDAFILSWTNLLIIPTLLITIYWGIKEKDWSDIKFVASCFFWSPFIWISGYLLLRFLLKTLLSVNEILSSFLRWLGN